MTYRSELTYLDEVTNDYTTIELTTTDNIQEQWEDKSIDLDDLLSMFDIDLAEVIDTGSIEVRSYNNDNPPSTGTDSITTDAERIYDNARLWASYCRDEEANSKYDDDIDKAMKAGDDEEILKLQNTLVNEYFENTTEEEHKEWNFYRSIGAMDNNYTLRALKVVFNLVKGPHKLLDLISLAAVSNALAHDDFEKTLKTTDLNEDEKRELTQTLGMCYTSGQINHTVLRTLTD